MDIGTIIGESFEYAKESIWEQWGRWILLLVAYLINSITIGLVPLFSGYMIRILGGTKPAPEVEDWGKLFVDGWKVNIITIVYLIIPAIISLILLGAALIPYVSIGVIESNPDVIGTGIMATILGALLLIPVLFVLWFIFTLFFIMGLIRFARTDSMGEAFNYRAISTHIGSIGWGNYILGLIVLFVVLIIISIILGIIQMIPVLGIIITFIVAPVVSIFIARYLSLVYDVAPAPA